MQAFFDELKAEQRDKNGRWQQVRKRNESFDLCRMIRAGMLRLGLDKIRDWNKVPAWLAPLDLNSNIVAVEDRQAEQDNAPIPVPPSESPPVRIVSQRPRRKLRSASSPYLR